MLCLQDFEVDDLGGLLAVLVANANRYEDTRSTLGLLHWLGDKVRLCMVGCRVSRHHVVNLVAWLCQRLYFCAHA